MTTPTQNAGQPTPAHTPGTVTIPVSVRGTISLAETASFVATLILLIINNGNLDPTALYTLVGGFIAHGVNHPAGNSPL